MNTHLITFVIPSRNRQRCLRAMLDNFVRFFGAGERDFKVIVLDNSDECLDAEYLDNLEFDFEYYHTSDNLSVVDNFNKGAQFVSGEFACFMGDDDVISIRVFELARLMKQREIDAAVISEKAKAIYFWPGVKDRRWGDVGSKLYLGKYSGKISILPIDAAVKNASIRCSDGPQSLPRAYSGIISKKSIDKILIAHGSLFGGCSPDIYSSRLLSSVISKVAYIDLPLLAAGASPASTSAARAGRSDVGGLTDNDHLSRFRHLEWDERVPKFYSPFTVWAQSYLQAEKKLGGDISSRSLAYVYAKCFIFARGNTNYIMGAFSKSDHKVVLSFYLLVYLITLPISFFVSKINLLFHRKPGGCAFEYSTIENSEEAAMVMDAAIAKIPLYINEH